MNQTASIASFRQDCTPTTGDAAGDHAEPVADILVVDDVMANLSLLVDILKEEGYRVRPVASGREALRAAAAQPPDMVLLDIDMPEMDGFEVCKALKSAAETQHVPVIFLSAFARPSDKVAAFSAGGVDYVTKPFQIEEVVQRVATHLHLESLKACLEDQNRELHARNRELEQIRKTQANLVHMIVHDLRSPLAGVLGYLELLQIGGADSLSEEILADVGRAVEACNSANDLVSCLLDIARLESAAMPMDIAPLDLGRSADAALNSQHSIKGQRTLKLHQGDRPVMVNADAGLVHRVLVNLLHNAIKATGEDDRIDLDISQDGEFARLQVIDTGRGIPADRISGLFEKFAQADQRRRHRDDGFGIGLAFCRLAVEAQGGSIGVESELGEGSRFWFTLPLIGGEQ
ncbi:MAG: hybrid sensor histidine kinase/response regulator [Pseudomonadota bacterium]